MTKIEKIKMAVANYMRSEGCTCCQDVEAHEEHAKILAELLSVPEYNDHSGFNFSLFRTPKN
jgi:hypothetical protein